MARYAAPRRVRGQGATSCEACLGWDGMSCKAGARLTVSPLLLFRNIHDDGFFRFLEPLKLLHGHGDTFAGALLPILLVPLPDVDCPAGEPAHRWPDQADQRTGPWCIRCQQGSTGPLTHDCAAPFPHCHSPLAAQLPEASPLVIELALPLAAALRRGAFAIFLAAARFSLHPCRRSATQGCRMWAGLATQLLFQACVFLLRQVPDVATQVRSLGRCNDKQTATCFLQDNPATKGHWWPKNNATGHERQ